MLLIFPHHYGMFEMILNESQINMFRQYVESHHQAFFQ